MATIPTTTSPMTIFPMTKVTTHPPSIRCFWILLRLLGLSMLEPLLVSGLIMGVCSQALAAEAPHILTYDILQEQTHDPRLFTQGLITQGELLVETSGGYGQSVIRRYRVDTGAILNQARFPANVFAEGATQVNDQLYVLTWREGVSYRLDATTLELREKYTFEGEGWGLTYDGQHLIMSDGSDRLTWRNPDNFAALDTMSVTGDGKHWHKLNELEYAEGYIWANIWQDSRILAIDPQSGAVKGILDLGELVKLNSRQPQHSVLNGIAYDSQLKAFWITGKLWPRRYLIKINWPQPDGK